MTINLANILDGNYPLKRLKKQHFSGSRFKNCVGQMMPPDPPNGMHSLHLYDSSVIKKKYSNFTYTQRVGKSDHEFWCLKSFSLQTILDWVKWISLLLKIKRVIECIILIRLIPLPFFIQFFSVLYSLVVSLG